MVALSVLLRNNDFPLLWLFFGVLPILIIVVIGLVTSFLAPRQSIYPFEMYLLLIGVILAGLATLWGLTFVGPIPLFLAVVALAIGVGVHCLRSNESLRRQREISSKCGHCGYDLRASHERCPECGGPLPEEVVRRRRIAAKLKVSRPCQEPTTPTEPAATENPAPPRAQP